MNLRLNICALGLVAAAAATGAPADPRAVYLACDMPAPSVCADLAEVLDATVKDRPVVRLSEGEALPGQHHLAVRFVPDRHTATTLSGHLAWTRPDGASGSGPTIEASTMDADLTDRALRGYAISLLENTHLPL